MRNEKFKSMIYISCLLSKNVKKSYQYHASWDLLFFHYQCNIKDCLTVNKLFLIKKEGRLIDWTEPRKIFPATLIVVSWKGKYWRFGWHLKRELVNLSPGYTIRGGGDPKISTRFEFSTPKNLPLEISNDDISWKIKIPFSPPLLLPVYAPRGNVIQKILPDLNLAPQNLSLVISHDGIGWKIKITPSPPLYAPRGVWSKKFFLIWIQHPKKSTSRHIT